MPKVKVKRKSTFIDMTAMSDVTVLLLTFFMLTATFVKKEPVQVTTPPSVSDSKIPENNIMQILIDHWTDGEGNDLGRIFLTLDKPADIMEVLKRVGKVYGVEFTEDELKNAGYLTSIGVPIIRNETAPNQATVQQAITLINQDKVTAKNPIGMKLFLALPQEYRDKAEKNLGIPNDSINNQFKAWMVTTRAWMDETERQGRQFTIAIKAGATTPYPVIKRVMNDLRELNENRYNLITSLKGGSSTGKSSEEGAH